MCGICGFIGFEAPGLIERMTSVIHHRGPDDAGHFEDGNIALGHRRLSIIDLAGGHQPMHTPDGAMVISFNGEIYNYRELREDLAARGHTFQTDSDTEVLLRLYQEEGPAALNRVNGMFAFAVFNRQTRELFLARDRVGIKPLYYMEQPGRLLFASETKALLEYDGFSRTINAPAVQEYLRLRYVPGRQTLFRDVKKLPPGHYLRYRNGQVEIESYWSPPLNGRGEEKRGEEDYFQEFKDLMRRSVKRRLISDVPFGAYLSGGVDSSVIVALMSEVGSLPVKTFSVGFDYEHDELLEAEATARRLGCEHRTVECRASDVATLLPQVIYHADEPLGDAISVPMFQLAREAKKEVTVILTGEGADEILSGYLFHKVMVAGHLYRKVVPSFLSSHVVQPMLSAAPASWMNAAFQYPAYLGERGKLKAVDYVRMLTGGSIADQYHHLISLFDDRDMGNLFTAEFAEQIAEQRAEQFVFDDVPGAFFDRMLRLQFDHWLPDNMLMRQDKMGMASGIEGRVPYLDHELVEFAFALPRNLRLKGLTGKYILRRFAQELLPRETSNRKKMPFYVPVENYFEQPDFMRLMEELLSPDAIARRGIFDPKAVETLRKAIRRKEFLLVKQVFSLMALELWFRMFVDGESVESLM